MQAWVKTSTLEASTKKKQVERHGAQTPNTIRGDQA